MVDDEPIAQDLLDVERLTRSMLRFKSVEVAERKSFGTNMLTSCKSRKRWVAT